MRNLIKMELYKLRTTKLLLVLLGIFSVVNAGIAAAGPLLMKAIGEDSGDLNVTLAEAFASPFSADLVLIFVFIAAVSFMYMDFSGGYIKNIAGQLPARGSIIGAKFVAVAVQNLIFTICGALSYILGSALAGGLSVESDNLLKGIATMFLKWLLSLALSAILMFFTVGLRSKTFATILAVVFSLGVLSFVYTGINTLITKVFKTEKIDINALMPDSLISSVDAIKNEHVVSSIIVSVVFIALFCALTYIVFNKKDIK